MSDCGCGCGWKKAKKSNRSMPQLIEKYAKGGAVVGPEPVKSDILQLISKYLGNARDLGNNVELPWLGGVGDLLVGEGAEAFDEYSRGYNPLSRLTMQGAMGGPLVNSEDAIKGLDAAGAVPLLGLPVRGAKALGKTAMNIPRIFADSMGPQVVSNVVKQKGGNWLAGDVENALKGLRPAAAMDTDYSAGLRALVERNPADFDSFAQFDRARPTSDMPRADSFREFFRQNPSIEPTVDYNAPTYAMDSWIQQKLAKYIKNEMATPEDPIRALAERGVLHVEPQTLGQDVMTQNRIGVRRERMGFPMDGLGGSDAARKWENASDSQVFADPAGNLMSGDHKVRAQNPWLLKVPPETMVNTLDSARVAENLGFNHLTDELRNAIDPNSGLPPELLWKYSDLNKVSVPQAVERVSQINAWRAANKAEANAKLANNAATVPYKDYPDSDYQWVELKQPQKTGKNVNTKVDADSDPDYFMNQAVDAAEAEGLDPDSDAFDDFVNRYLDAADYDPQTNKQIANFDEDESMAQLRSALKYEGDTMGHCVGGYCNDVASGKSRIYSLRNKKTGEPHTTIEVAPPTHGGMSYDEMRQTHGDDVDDLDWTPQIIQIKGKGNKAPVDKYLPYVQDFVRSGRWSDVGDLGNARMIKHPETGEYVTGASRRKEVLDEPDDGYASGGLVAAPEASYNADRVNALAQSLLDEMNG